MKSFVLAAVVALFYSTFSYVINLPQNVGQDVPEGKLKSLSFAPYREDQGPIDKKFPNAAELETDVEMIAKRAHAIRTYASSEGRMPLIPPLARKYGLQLLQGAWLDSVVATNRIEIAELIRSANANPDIVKRVIVGNEVLLRGDLKPEQLIEYIREVRRSIKQPVSYADVWSMYMKYPQLIKEVDFVTIHILPYWEDEPIAVEMAPAHIERIFKQVQQEANALVPNIPILIGESGWPGAGRQRGFALPSVINEAKFIRGFIKVATENNFDYNIVEAINQSWKSDLEGVVGANWGLYSVDRKEVFPLVGKVYEDADWYNKVLVSIGCFFIVLVTLRKRVNHLPMMQQFIWLSLTQILLALLIEQADFLWYTSYNLWQRLQVETIIVINVLVFILIMLRSIHFLTGEVFPARLSQWLYHTLTLSLIYAVFKTLSLGFRGRYISFPSSSVSVSVVGILGLIIIALFTLKSLYRPWNIQVFTGFSKLGEQWDRRLGWFALLSGIYLIIRETRAFFIARDLLMDHPDISDRLLLALKFTLFNGQLLVWLASLIILAIPFCLSKRNLTG